jgi:hypothetical protein
LEHDGPPWHQKVNDLSSLGCALVFGRASKQIRPVNAVDAQHLREQAAHGRRLASMIGDERASRALIELAEEYEAKAATAGKTEALP